MNFEDLLNASFSLRRDAVDAITLWCGTRQGKSLFQDKSKRCSKAIVFRCRDRSCPFYMKLMKRTDRNWQISKKNLKTDHINCLATRKLSTRCLKVDNATSIAVDSDNAIPLPSLIVQVHQHHNVSIS